MLQLGSHFLAPSTKWNTVFIFIYEDSASSHKIEPICTKSSLDAHEIMINLFGFFPKLLWNHRGPSHARPRPPPAAGNHQSSVRCSVCPDVRAMNPNRWSIQLCNQGAQKGCEEARGLITAAVASSQGIATHQAKRCEGLAAPTTFTKAKTDTLKFSHLVVQLRGHYSHHRAAQQRYELALIRPTRLAL